jgi:hypothetical protein
VRKQKSQSFTRRAHWYYSRSGCHGNQHHSSAGFRSAFFARRRIARAAAPKKVKSGAEKRDKNPNFLQNGSSLESEGQRVRGTRAKGSGASRNKGAWRIIDLHAFRSLIRRRSFGRGLAERFARSSMDIDSELYFGCAQRSTDL